MRLVVKPPCSLIVNSLLGNLLRGRIVAATIMQMNHQNCHLTPANHDSCEVHQSKTFLFWFSNEYSNFRDVELQTLFDIFRIDERIFRERRVVGPYVLMKFPTVEEPLKIMSRSVLAHACYELWGEGQSRENLESDVRSNFWRMEPYTHQSFRMRVETYGKSIQHTEKLEHIDTFSYLPWKGKVDLKNPECSLHLLLYYGLDPNKVPSQPYHWYFGRWISDGQRRLSTQTSLKTRQFIGNTSMDPLLSLIMANLASVKPFDMVLDPFVGTGSILVGAALMGGIVLGSDIDFLMLHGRTRPSRANKTTREEGESIRGNMRQYGMESKYVDVVIGDASLPLWRDDVQFDAIITDPPYGIREPTKRLGTSKSADLDFKIKEEHLSRHYPAKREYSLTDIYCDLMNRAVQRLRFGGKLVYWIPISRVEYDQEKLPKNPCLKLISNVEQVLTAAASRRLLVFEKMKEPLEESNWHTVIDATALMYRFKFFENESGDARKIRKAEVFSFFGAATKRGQLFPPSSRNIKNTDDEIEDNVPVSSTIERGKVI